MIVVLALAGLALAGLAAGARLGRWPLWLLGYGLTVAALIIALVRPW